MDWSEEEQREKYFYEAVRQSIVSQQSKGSNLKPTANGLTFVTSARKVLIFGPPPLVYQFANKAVHDCNPVWNERCVRQTCPAHSIS